MLETYAVRQCERYTVGRCKRDRLRPWQRMRRGVRLLDRVMPGWPEYVNQRTLDMGSDSHCVLAQLDSDPDEYMGSYEGGLYRVGLSSGTRHGFDVMDVGAWAVNGRYKRLTAQWVAYLRSALVIKEIRTAR